MTNPIYTEAQLEEINEDDLIDRYENDLTPIELHFLNYFD